MSDSRGASDRLSRAKIIYLAARELGLAERDEFIQRESAGDEALRNLVLELLGAEGLPLPFESLADDIRAANDQSPTASISSASRDGAPGGGRGDRIGNYRLLERIGEGGFGVVFMAEQERPVRRRVALKIIKLGMDTKQVVARFEAERQALALMDHPGIARVFDAGTTETGRPYFVMELVRGLPITEFCDARKLSVKERLHIMTQVCDALQHAHQKGIIHRDIKPSNVLVTEADGKPLPKIIDFGIAKATHARLTEKTIFTEFRQMIGTPEYMSPEQAGQSAEDVDTRSDVYSTGVLLYELLTGATPFDSKRLRSAAFGELQRIIREEDPPKPSVKLKSRADDIGTVASMRATQPARLSITIHGELDWIVMKSLEKDRSRRYDSAGTMGQDIRRYLAGEAIQAAPPSKTYLARKFIARNKGSVLASVLLAAALVVGLVGTSLGFLNAERQRRVAVEQKHRADENAAEARSAESVATRNAYSANLMSASSAMNAIQYSAARAFLDAAPSELRGWEWRVLHDRLDTSIRAVSTTATPISSELGGLNLHPDGRSFLTYSGVSEPLVQRWDLSSGRLLQSIPSPFPPQPRQSSWFRLIDDGRRLVTFPRYSFPASKRVPVDVWDLSTGQRLTHAEIDADAKGFLDAIVHPDGAHISIYTADRVRRIEVATGAIRAEHTLKNGMFPLGCSPDGAMIVESTIRLAPDRLVVRDARTLVPMFDLEGHAGLVLNVEFSNDHRWLGSAADDSTARIWDLSARPPSSLVLHHPFRVGKLCFSPDSSCVATICIDRAIRIWDRASGRLLGTYASESLDPYSLMFMPDGKAVAGIEADGTLRIWDITLESAPVLRGHKNIVSKSFFVKEDSGLIVSSSWDGLDDSGGSIRLWDADSGELVAAVPGRAGDVTIGLAISADGRHAVAGITNDSKTLMRDVDKSASIGRLLTIDLSTGETVGLGPSLGHIRWVTYADNDRSIIVADHWGGTLPASLRVLDARSGAEVRSRTLDERHAWVFAQSPDGKTLALPPGRESIASGRPATSQTLLFLNAQTLETERQSDNVPSGQLSAAFSPDGKRLATGGADGLLHVFDVATGKCLATMSGHSMEILAIAFSPDGSRIASAGVDRKVRLWSGATCEQLAAFAGHEGHIGGIDWDAPGERLISCSGDSTIRMWEPSPIRTRLQARSARDQALTQVSPLVDTLFNELHEPRRVIDRLKADAALSPIARKTALQLVLRRGIESRSEPTKPSTRSSDSSR